MNLLDRLNRRIAARVHGNRPRVFVEGEELVLLSGKRERQAFPLTELTEATLSHRDVYAADAVVLRLGFANGREVEIFQDDTCWFDLTAALDQSGKIPVPSIEWQLRFLATGDGTPSLDLMALPRT